MKVDQEKDKVVEHIRTNIWYLHGIVLFNILVLKLCRGLNAGVKWGTINHLGWIKGGNVSSWVVELETLVFLLSDFGVGFLGFIFLRNGEEMIEECVILIVE